MEPLPEYVLVGDGPSSLVFLHGLGGDHTNWQPQLAEFSPEYRCLAWTLPGYGGSPAMASLTWPKLSDMLLRVLDHAGITRATVIGLSMGGYLAQQFAVDHKGRVDKLVLAATSAQFGRGNASFKEKYLAARLTPLDDGTTPADLASDVVQALLSVDASPEAIANATASMSGISAAAYRQAIECLVTWDFDQHLDQIEAPTLCIAGEHDRTAPVAALKALASGIPNATVAVIPNCQHLMNLDRPAEFNALLGTFLTPH